MRVAAAALALAVSAVPGLAQDARVRSGEHDTFSRLVIYLPQAADFEADAGDQSFAIDFGESFGFDTSDVFYYIPRTRIADLTSGPGRIELDLACDCPVVVERLSDVAVFLDVKDPDAETTSTEATSGDPGSSVPQPTPMEGPGFAPAIRLPPVTVASVATLLPGGLSIESDAIGETIATVVPKTETQASGAAVAVAEQIARAAAQGLVEARDPVVPLRPERPQPRRVEPKPIEEAVEAETGTGTRRHISIRSSVDEALGRDVAEALGELGTTGPCLADQAFDVASWARNGVEDLARLRPKVIGDLDRANPEGVANLARAYIALSFGAEARHVVEAFEVVVPDRRLLLAMADIIDHGEARRHAQLSTQYDCPGAGAMWAVLARAEIPDGAEIDTDAVTLAFSALPANLRALLGPPLANRLLDHGAKEAAAVIRTATLRAPGTPSVETALLDAEIALETGREDQGDEKLAEVVRETSGRSLEAVQRLIERRLAKGEPIEEDLLAAADALVYEFRGTSKVRRLSELRIEGLAKSGKAERALQVLEGRHDLPHETVDRLRGVVYSEAARLLDDADFLLVAVKAPEALGRTPEEMAARRAVARRLAEMELYSLAETLGVEEGLIADTRAAGPASVNSPRIQPVFPTDETPLERTAVLLEQSAALRQQLEAALSGSTETE